jgi:hypothetical protein
MRRYGSIGLLLILIPALGLAKTKKHNDVPAVFQNAHFVYVEAVDGDLMKPGLFPDDRQAIVDIEDGLRDWNRYVLATRRTEADVVLVVRKGRAVGAQVHGGIGVSSRAPVGATSSRGTGQPGQAGGQPGDSDNVGAEAEIGPANDLLRVYLVNGDGKLSGPLWTREMQDGLDAPGLMLLQQLRTAVERAYPSQPPPTKQPTP